MFRIQDNLLVRTPSNLLDRSEDPLVAKTAARPSGSPLLPHCSATAGAHCSTETAGWHMADYHLVGGGQCASAVVTLEECRAAQLYLHHTAGQAVVASSPATDDGYADGVSFRPAHCYLLGNVAMFNAGGVNTGTCSAGLRCVCHGSWPVPPLPPQPPKLPPSPSSPPLLPPPMPPHPPVPPPPMRPPVSSPSPSPPSPPRPPYPPPPINTVAAATTTAFVITAIGVSLLLTLIITQRFLIERAALLRAAAVAPAPPSNANRHGADGALRRRHCWRALARSWTSQRACLGA